MGRATADELPYLCSVKKRKQELDSRASTSRSYSTQAAKDNCSASALWTCCASLGLYGSALASLVAELHGQSPLLVLLRDEGRRRATSIPTSSSSCWGVRPSSLPSAYRRALRYGHRTRHRCCCAPWCWSRLSEEGGRLPILISTPRQCRSWCRRCVRPATSAIRSARRSWWIATSCAIGCWAGASSAWTTSTSRAACHPREYLRYPAPAPSRPTA